MKALLQRVSEASVSVAGEEVGVLEQTCGPSLDRGLRLVLDLRGVRSIDDAGLALLERWSRRGLHLHRASAFIRQVLEGRGLRCGNDGGADQ